MNLKKLSLFVIAVVATFCLVGNVSAASDVSLSCTPKTIKYIDKKSETATCTVKVKSDVPIKKASVVLDVSEYLIVSNVKANTAAGWKYSSSSDTANGEYGFSSTNGSIPAGEYELFSFNLSLSDQIVNIKDNTEKCGKLCIASVMFDDAEKPVASGDGTCFKPTPTFEECVGDECEPNPETGAFMNYVLLGAGVAVAIGAIVIARRNNKFYRV